MSYQVLARKWRPRFFREMVGQEHVLQALINALDHDRLHHAYLFTGTRGVGKTSIARILAKSLNCETGVSSEPCGKCSACVEISQGCFVDLIEVDAASRTKVEDTRELLDNVQYAPSKGRYKVYLIDEVHMLSGHSFNALLKTLEEPPEHVKFLLATTDPQKLPATILSRCLQFHLKNMPAEAIVKHLSHILTQEMVEFDESALWPLAKSAAGSMRDALSLTDQAIAFGSGSINVDQVSAMLGSIDLQTVYRLVQGLIDQDAGQILQTVAQFSEQAPNYTAVMDELLQLLHRLTLAQMLPDSVDNAYGDQEQVLQLAQQLSAEELQLYYQMGLLGKRDLHLAPDLRVGFEMALLRMLAFRPAGVTEPPRQALTASVSEPSRSPAHAEVALKKPEAGAQPADQSKMAGGVEPQVAEPSVTSKELPAEKALEKPVQQLAGQQLEPQPKKALNEPAKLTGDLKAALAKSKPEQSFVQPSLQNKELASNNVDSAQDESSKPNITDVANEQVPAGVDANAESQEANAEFSLDTHTPIQVLNHQQWLESFEQFAFDGLLKSIADECVLTFSDGARWIFALSPDKAHFLNDQHAGQMAQALTKAVGQEVSVVINIEQTQLQTPAEYAAQLLEQAKAQALLSLQNDTLLQEIQQRFSAQLLTDSVKAK